MSIIEGVGDEVTQFCLVVFCGLIAILAWWSTAQRPRRLRAALIVDRNTRQVYRLLPSSSAGRSRRQLRVRPRHFDSDSPLDIRDLISFSTIETSNNSTNNSENNLPVQTIENIERNSIVSAMDSDNSTLRNRRLAFFENRPTEAENVQSESSAVVSDQIHIPLNVKKEKEDDNEDNNVNKNDANDVVPENSEEKVENKDESNDDTKKSDNNNSDNIRIRLKYLNDDLKLVEGSLQELLGDFKRRHFKVELNARKLVRLIFNGQVLQREAATLESCGLFDNCVVHCLVHQPRTQQQFAQVQQQLSPTNIPLVNTNNSHIGEHGRNRIMPIILTNSIQEERDWDLSHILFTLLASLLSIAWYIHIRFSSLFGLQASLAMLGLTGIYIVAVICVYFSETQPVNNTNNLNNVNNVPLDVTETRD